MMKQDSALELGTIISVNSILASISIIPLVGLIFGLKGEKSRLKYLSIVGNLLVFLTVGLLSMALIVYDFLPQ